MPLQCRSNSSDSFHLLKPSPESLPFPQALQDCLPSHLTFSFRRWPDFHSSNILSLLVPQGFGMS